MISDFLSLELLQESTHSRDYVCSLPNPDIYGDFKMIVCGHIHIQENIVSGECAVQIELLDNFESLCIGDTYQRRYFVYTVLDIIRWDSDYVLECPKIVLKDYIGSYVGYAHTLDIA